MIEPTVRNCTIALLLIVAVLVTIFTTGLLSKPADFQEIVVLGFERDSVLYTGAQKVSPYQVWGWPTDGIGVKNITDCVKDPACDDRIRIVGKEARLYPDGTIQVGAY